MAQHVNMPRFGDWETNDDVPYTVVFEKARHKKKDVKRTPSNPQQSPSTFSDNHSPVQATLFQSETNSGAPNGREALRTNHVRSSSREDGYLRTNSDSLQHRDTVNPKVSTDSPLHRHGSIDSVGTPKRATRQNVGSDRRIEHSPLNANHQAKVPAQVSGMPSPAWERKGSTERGNNLASLTPGRSRLRPVTQSAETPDHSAAVPKFGEWDESDPTSADGFTHVFNKVREEKMNGTGNVSAAAFRKPYYKDQKQHENKTSKKCCCFPMPW